MELRFETPAHGHILLTMSTGHQLSRGADQHTSTFVASLYASCAAGLTLIYTTVYQYDSRRIRAHLSEHPYHISLGAFCKYDKLCFCLLRQPWYPLMKYALRFASPAERHALRTILYNLDSFSAKGHSAEHFGHRRVCSRLQGSVACCVPPLILAKRGARYVVLWLCTPHG